MFSSDERRLYTASGLLMLLATVVWGAIRAVLIVENYNTYCQFRYVWHVYCMA